MLRDHLVQLATIERRAATRDLHGGTAAAWEVDSTLRPCLVREMQLRAGPDQGRDGSRREARIYFDADPEVDRGHRIRVGARLYEVIGSIDFNSLHRLYAVTASLVVN